jgi:hypothetical protein
MMQSLSESRAKPLNRWDAMRLASVSLIAMIALGVALALSDVREETVEETVKHIEQIRNELDASLEAHIQDHLHAEPIAVLEMIKQDVATAREERRKMSEEISTNHKSGQRERVMMMAVINKLESKAVEADSDREQLMAVLMQVKALLEKPQ